MSELANARENGKNYRWRLLATVSAIALIGVACGASRANATDDDSDRSPIWIELGGQLSRLSEGQEAFSPPSMDVRPSMFSPSGKFERLPLYSVDESGKISFEPQDTSWVFSASVRYGRSIGNKHVHQQTSPATFIPTRYGHPAPSSFSPVAPSASHFADTMVRNGESHAIVDFQAGRDFGLGMLGGSEGSSVLNLGVRFAQFSTKSNIALKSDPDWHFSTKYVAGFHIVDGQAYHSNRASLQAAQSFHGIGPSISWNASAPLLSGGQCNELTFDWGINAAALFGRQRANVAHQETGRYHKNGALGEHITVYQPTPVDVERTKSVTVPNVGGFAGATWRIQNFKVSAGYRADLFFGAMDGGIDAAKKENVGFYGPFATVSVGIGG